VIPFDYITEWRAQAPWTTDAQIEQDLVLSRAVVTMFAVPDVAGSLAFRGGTALYKLHLRAAARYSEDIDLVQVEPGPIGPVLDAIRRAIDPWLGFPKRTTREGRVVLLYRMSSESQPSVPMRLKIEINSREHFTVFGIQNEELSVQSRWFTGTATVRTYHLDELLGTKLRALYQRKKGRDVFDLYIASRLAKVDPRRIVECFTRYLEHDGVRVTRAELEMNLDEKLSDPTFASDIAPLVASGVEWTVEDAASFLYREVLPLLPGDAWKRGERSSRRGTELT
jgi:predicted nucleotidyltransferase component of viral defense system